MTTAATATVELAVDDLIKLAWQLNGFGPQPPSPDDLAIGRQVLALGLNSLTNYGIVVRQKERVELALVADRAYVDPAGDTISIEKGGVIRDTGSPAGEIPITMRSMADYQMLTSKSTSGMPSYYYPEQLAAGSFRIWLFPVPTAEWPTLIVPRTRLPRAVSTGDVTLDLDQRWHLALTYFMQAQLFSAKGRADLAKGKMKDFVDEASGALENETERGDAVLLMTETGWEC